VVEAASASSESSVSAMTDCAHADDFTALKAEDGAVIAAIIYRSLGKDPVGFGFIESLIRSNHLPPEIAG